MLPGRHAICRLAPDAAIPDWARGGDFCSITHTADELSIVCDEAAVPSDVKQDRGWRCLKLQGPLDLYMTGVLAAILDPIAKADVSIFSIATYDTDHVLVREAELGRAITALEAAGYEVARPSS